MRPVLLLTMLLLAGCSGSQTDAVTRLVYATQYSPAHPFSRADKVWMDYVERRSGGTLRVVPSWSGALLSAEHSMLELRHGVADIGLITPIYVKGGAHLIRIQSGFYAGTQEIEQQVALYRCIAEADAQIERELQGLIVLAVQGGSTPGIVTRERRIDSLADLRGLRIRVPTELLPVLRGLGADPVNMPMGEVYSALAKGVIDGVVAPEDTFRSLHLAEVTKYFAHLAIPRGAYPARAMGSRRWNALSAEHQGILRDGIPVWERALAEENRRALEQGKQLARDEGVVETWLPAEDQVRFDALYVHDAEQNAAGLARYGIDGLDVLKRAQASVGERGAVHCVAGNAP